MVVDTQIVLEGMLHSHSLLPKAGNLAKTRDLLLPKLMSGEIRVREAEKEVEAVA